MSLIKILFRRPQLVLIGILVLASFLRLYKLDQVPPSLYWEEAALGYDAYSISQTGKDHHGNPFPILAFPSFGDYKPSGYFYAIVPFVKLLGLNAWSVRLPSAVSGVASVFLVYLIGKELFSKRVGLVASFLFAIQPWAVQFSRGGWEVNLSLMLVLLGAWLLIRAYKYSWSLCGAVISFGLAMYTYHAARLFAPLIGIIGGGLLMWFWWKEKALNLKTKAHRKTIQALVVSGFLAVLFVLPFVFNLGNQAVSSRFSQTSIFSDITPIFKSNEALERSNRTIVDRIVHHRYRYFGEIILSQYFRHFSPEFLFVRGDGNLRHSNGTMGLLYPVELLGILASLVFMVTKRQKQVFLVWLWILVAGIAPSLVTPAPHALRFLYASAGFSLLTAAGLITLLDFLSKWRKQLGGKILIAKLSIAYIYFFASFVAHYFVVYPVQAANDWQYGYKELYEGLAKTKQDGEQVYVTREQGRPSMYYLFFSKFDPKTLQEMEPSLPKDQLELRQVGDYHFVDEVPPGKGLYATSLSRRDPNSDLIGYIRRPDWSIVWAVWRR